MIEELLDIRGLSVNVKYSSCDKSPILVFLHGFTGSISTWSEVVESFEGKYKIVAIDLTGHGKTAAPANSARYSMEEQLADLEAVFGHLSLQNCTLIGYSMGGRIALAYTNKYPKRVKSLILESASPGLKTEIDRTNRKEADKSLSVRIINEGIPSFIDFWENISLFDSQKKLPKKKQLAIREERLRQSEIGLSNSLLGIGTGRSSYWDKLDKITVPILLITGELDIKFVTIAQEMKKLLPLAHHLTIKDAGHAIHVEKPTLFATMIEEHITEVYNFRR